MHWSGHALQTFIFPSTLSLCVEALESMLYPFSWQHTFVPILPLDMTDVLDAPAPFLIGVLRSAQNPWDKTLDEVRSPRRIEVKSHC